jgi:signal transduction histidine kinase
MSFGPDTKMAKLKTRPISLQSRFLILQSLTFLLAVWFILAATYVTYRIEQNFEKPLTDLRSALAFDLQLDAKLGQIAAEAVGAHRQARAEPTAAFLEAERRLRELMAGYVQLDLPAGEVEILTEVQRVQEAYLVSAASLFARTPAPQTSESRLEATRALYFQISALLHRLRAQQVDRLVVSSNQLRNHRTMLFLILGAFAACGVLILLRFRQLHSGHLWKPLEGLRQTVLEMRRGNLRARCEVPESVELRPLAQTLEETASQLAEMKESLERKVAERTASLEAAQDQLVQAAKFSALGRLISGVAHEINNPLTSILGFSEVVLMREDLDARTRAHIETVREQSLRVRNLVANLAAYAQIGPQRSARIDLRSVADRLVELRAYQLRANNIVLHYSRPAGPLWVRADGDHLLQVFFNLLLNAEQAIRPYRNGSQGEIWLDLDPKGRSVEVSVRDNGSGMPAEVQSRVFDPFFSTRPTGEGKGLGLSVSLGIVRRMGGDIHLHSREGEGTTVQVALPLDLQGTLDAPLPEKKSNGGSAGEPPRALVIDDEAGITVLVEEALARDGWRATVLTNSTEAEAALAAARFRLVICDLKMPGMSGIDVFRMIRARHPELARRFILMTGNVTDAEEFREELAGVPILCKPFTLSQLREVVRQLMQP